MLPQLAISYTHPAEEADFAQFRAKLESSGADVAIERREKDGPQAGLEWLIPTAVIVFIGKAYIDGFVKEIGKDHYALLKEALRTLYRRFVGPEAPAATVVATAGKSRAPDTYSLLFSLLAEAPDGLRFKLLIHQGATAVEYEDAVSSFLAFVEQFNSAQLTAEAVAELRDVRTTGKTILLAYDQAKKRVVPVDPLGNRAQ